MIYSRVSVITKGYALILFGSSIITALLLELASKGLGRWLSPIYILNAKAADDALNVKISIPVIVFAMSFAVLAISISMGFKSINERRRFLVMIWQPMNLDRIPDSFPPDSWLDTPLGALAVIYGMDVILAKAGATITSTVVGVCMFLLFNDKHNAILFCGSFLTMIMVAIFPYYVRRVLLWGYMRKIRNGNR